MGQSLPAQMQHSRLTRGTLTNHASCHLSAFPFDTGYPSKGPLDESGALPPTVSLKLCHTIIPTLSRAATCLVLYDVCQGDVDE
ncbi:hypothetical protein PtA15_7A441 [Puccinia triticina]|uniref:Uncharacterized protein n=1 Tax=Puccinia triticina TaxID=208348 RepID=A0ABY7CQW6_9BASI|nr:uncharacterized protein PtA15_7A441 [Puccinia triticina]WAQ86713.1 hypothetical protein PtA15_7A441 [Puccinia triticina]